MPWRRPSTARASRHQQARVLLYSMMILGALGTGLGGTDATVTPEPDALELLPLVPVTSSTTTTTVPLDVDVPAAPAVGLPAGLSPAVAGEALG